MKGNTKKQCSRDRRAVETRHKDVGVSNIDVVVEVMSNVPKRKCRGKEKWAAKDRLLSN